MQVNGPANSLNPNNDSNPQATTKVDADNPNLKNDNCIFALKNFESALIRENTVKISKEKLKLLQEAKLSKEEITKKISASTRIEFLCIKNLLTLTKNSIC